MFDYVDLQVFGSAEPASQCAVTAGSPDCTRRRRLEQHHRGQRRSAAEHPELFPGHWQCKYTAKRSGRECSDCVDGNEPHWLHFFCESSKNI